MCQLEGSCFPSTSSHDFSFVIMRMRAPTRNTYILLPASYLSLRKYGENPHRDQTDVASWNEHSQYEHDFTCTRSRHTWSRRAGTNDEITEALGAEPPATQHHP